jgi:glutamate synthase domain-containing protein 2
VATVSRDAVVPGIATTDSELADLFEEDWATQRLTNMYHAWYVQLVEILWKFGMRSIRELVGRTDLLEHIDYRRETEFDDNG